MIIYAPYVHGLISIIIIIESCPVAVEVNKPEANKPTYGELIDLFMECEGPDILLRKKFPNLRVGRPGHFYETVSRIAAPTKRTKLIGSPLSTYRKRLWEPRVRNIRSRGMHLLLRE